MARTGRPTKFKPEFVAVAKGLARLGATDAEMATAFGVTVSTVALWKVQHKDFSDAQRVGKAMADQRVEASLYRRAMGYEHDETDLRVVGARLVKTPIRKHYPPDTTACIFWLKNRKPKDWRDKHDVEHSGSVSLAQALGALNDAARGK